MKKKTESTAIATRDTSLGFELNSFDEMLKFATSISKSGLIPDAYRGKPQDIIVTLLTGRELGISPMQSLRGIHVIKGKAVMSSDLIVALVKRDPSCRYFSMVESDEKKAVYETHRTGAPKPQRITFSIEDARRAQLAGRDNWKKYPAAMLRARCMAALARAVYPDVCFGLYDTDEIQPQVEVVEAAAEEDPKPKKAPKKKAPKKAEVATVDSTMPAEYVEPEVVVDAELVEPFEEEIQPEQSKDAFAEMLSSVENQKNVGSLRQAGVKIKEAFKMNQINQAQRDVLAETYRRVKGQLESSVVL
jgi:hypothetical protein